MTLSIAMCTYNGSRYLDEQLESLLRQTRLPDELVVCDDGSSDATADILSAFAERAPFPVRIHINPVNLGSTKNFERAISLCTGDLIALSDQDDVWLPEKLERAEQMLAQRPEMLGVFSDAHVTDESLRPSNVSLWDAVSFDTGRRRRFRNGQAFSVLLQRTVVTGTTFTFRAARRDLILPIPEQAVHDAWIALMLAAVGEIAFLEVPLVLYRQHGRNQIGAAKHTVWDQVADAADPDSAGAKRAYLQKELQLSRLALQRLQESRYQFHDARKQKLLVSKIQHLESRLSLPQGRLRRTIPIFKEMISGRYSKYSYGAFSAARDLAGARIPNRGIARASGDRQAAQ